MGIVEFILPTRLLMAWANESTNTGAKAEWRSGTPSAG